MAAKVKKADNVVKEEITAEVGTTNELVSEGAVEQEMVVDGVAFVSEQEIAEAIEIPVMREAYWVCAECETDTRKYRDGYHHAEFDQGHIGAAARNQPVCPECGSDQMTFHAEGQDAVSPVWDIEHQCWRLPDGSVQVIDPEARMVPCPFCASACPPAHEDPTKHECYHCHVLIES